MTLKHFVRLLLLTSFALVLAGCGCPPQTLSRVEVRRKTTKGREEIVYVLVDRAKLRKAGVTEAEPKALVDRLFSEVDELMAEGVRSALGYPPQPRPEPPKTPSSTEWVATVFPSGIPLEVVAIESDGSRTTESMIIPLTKTPK